MKGSERSSFSTALDEQSVRKASQWGELCFGDLYQRLSNRELWHELKIGVRLGGPILLGQCAQMLSPLIDTVMAGRVGPEDLAAVALGNTIWVGVLLFSIGLLGAIQPLIANAVGARLYTKILPLIKAGCFVALLLTLMGLFVFTFAWPLLSLSGASQHLIDMAQSYLMGISIGIFPCFLIFAIRGYCEGLGDARLMMWLWCFMAAINIPLNLLFIHGYGPLPALGGVGCGYATSVTHWLGLCGFIGWAYKRNLFQLSSWGVSSVNAVLDQSNSRFSSAFRAILKLGLPSAFHLLVEGLTFSGLAMLVAVFGPNVIAANQIALNITSFVFMVPLSIGFAYTIRVAYLRGAGKTGLVIALTKSSMWVVALMGALLATLLLTMGETLVSFYTKDPSVVQSACMMLMVAASFQVMDIGQVLMVAILRGFEDTEIPMWINLLAHWGVGLPAGFALARTDVIVPALGPVGLWFGLLIGLVLASGLLFWRVCWVLRRAENAAGLCSPSEKLGVQLTNAA